MESFPTLFLYLTDVMPDVRGLFFLYSYLDRCYRSRGQLIDDAPTLLNNMQVLYPTLPIGSGEMVIAASIY